MIKLKKKYNLPFCDLEIAYKGEILEINDVLIDTGSGGTILKMDVVEKIGLTIDINDEIEAISGIGGKEFVFIKKIDFIKIGSLKVNNFKVEIGTMDYDFNINGIVGMDFLEKTGAIINLREMSIDGYEFEG
jgi:predicted aspartyl protease